MSIWLFIISKSQYYASHMKCPNCFATGAKPYHHKIDSVVKGHKVSGNIAICQECGEHIFVTEESYIETESEGTYLVYEMQS